MTAPDEESTVRGQTVAALRASKLPPTDAGVAAVVVKLAQAIDDIDESGLNPAGKLDNVSIPTYLKYAEALGMTPNSRARAKAVKAAPTPPASSGDDVAAMRARRAGRPA